MNFLKPYRVVLLDMNSTFMFGEDRFGDGEDFAATYRKIGGARLRPQEIEEAIRSAYASMAEDYKNPAKYDDFPQVRDVLLAVAPHLPLDEVALLELVFGLHELGRVDEKYGEYLRNLARTHRLGLVANIWCKKELWLRELQRAGVLGLFESTVFSSDHKSIKPSPALFELAMMPLDTRKSEIVFVGDSLRCDVEGAKAAGLSTVWINPARGSHPAADLVVGDLLELA
jgi:FMN phosphatase YigB (HAD superfamily)